MLLEKNLAFDPVSLKLSGEQFAPEFMEINPFHHVPVLIDDGVRLVESLAFTTERKLVLAKKMNGGESAWS